MIKGWWNRMFTTDIKKQFGVEGIESKTMREAVDTWLRTYQGSPEWIDPLDGIKSIKFAKFICEEAARLACLDIDVSFDGKRKEQMQSFWDKSILPRLREWLEYGLCTGSLILKPNGSGVDFVTPDRFQITETDGNGNITGCVFQDTYQDEKKYITKLEYHSFWKAAVRMPNSDEYKEVTYYRIVNKAFMSNTETNLGVEIDLRDTKWANLSPVTDIVKQNNDKLDGMLFGFFKMPLANDIDLGSPLGVSIFNNALEELEDLDTAYSRNSTEIRDSKRTVLVDDRLTDITSVDSNGERHRTRLKLPSFVKNIFSDNPSEFYQEINPTLNTTVRKEGIDSLLSLIGCKCGFSNGYFVLDQKTGMITATQVEADDRRTIQTIKDIRDKLKVCIEELLYAQSVFMDLYNLAPVGDYEPHFNFGDITYNYAEDKETWWKYVQSGKMPAWKYFVKFEGMSEDEAKQLQEEMQTESNLFAAE